jgi:glucose/arabinose dehydrogenase
MILLFIILSILPASAQELTRFKFDSLEYRVDQLLKTDEIIWGLEFVSQDHILFTKKNGKLGLFEMSTKKLTELSGLPAVHNVGQGGLLDLALEPGFKDKGFVYITYSKKLGDQQTTALARALFDLKIQKFSEWKDIFIAKALSKSDHHYGSRIVMDTNYLYLTVGERGHDALAQDLSVHNGKVLRLKHDGTVAEGNPFSGKPGALPEIWSYGHRNPQGLYLDLKSNTLFEQEHGPRGGDEINVIEGGKNYGWPIITYGREYSGRPVGKGIQKAEGLEQPIKFFVPSIAPSGLLKYQSNVLPGFVNTLVSGALVQEHLNVVKLSCTKNCETKLLKELSERMRDVKEGPDGLIYIATDSGKILRVSVR